MNEKAVGEEEYGPWNPGLESHIPKDVLPLSTMFRSENVLTGLGEAQELADLTGLPVFDVVAFRPERLAAHEVLVRVTADLTVRDGPNYEDLGISLRGMVVQILDCHVLPEIETLTDVYKRLQERTENFLRAELEETFFSTASSKSKETQTSFSLLARLFRRQTKKLPVRRPMDDSERASLATKAWQERIETLDDFEVTCLKALVRTVNAFVGRHGRLSGGQEPISKVACTLVLNDYGARVISETIQPFIEKAIEAEGYRVLPPQEKPVVMNVKGASASGKSSMRALQRDLAKRLDIPWDDFALISPDYWRKFLIDYDTLGPHYKYGGMLSGHELAIIDRKLDRHMAEKGKRGVISHLLIDRFRFDSFSPEQDSVNGTRLLTRFGHLVFLFFMVTPPEATVERAWKRGIATGRYKAVEDLLYHNIEAYTGMPQLFFSWMLSRNRTVHFEFLDNSVSEGEKPKTIAYGWNDEMTVLDVCSMLNIERFRNINIDAQNPGEVYENRDVEPNANSSFLEKCVEKMQRLRFQNPATGGVAGEIRSGDWLWQSRTHLSEMEGACDQLELCRVPENLPENDQGEGNSFREGYIVGDAGIVTNRIA